MAVALGIILSRGVSYRRWPIAAMLVLLCGGVGLSLGDHWLLWLSAAGGISALLLPMLIGTYAVRLGRRGQFRAASDWAEKLGWLSSDWREAATQWRLVSHFYEGDSQPLEEQVIEWTALGDAASLGFRDTTYMFLGRWASLQYSAVLEYRVRALSELGHLEQAALEFASAWQSQRGLRSQRALRRAALPLLAFTGRVESVRRLLVQLRATEGVVQYWLYTALMGAGQFDTASLQKANSKAHAIDNPLLRARWLDREERPIPSGQLDPSLTEVLDCVAAEIDSTYRLRLEWFWHYPFVTTMLALACCGFCLQFIRGGVHDPLVAVSLGALLAEGYLPMQWWRLFAYGFLHFGWLHLLTNLIVLSLAGPIVCRTHGKLSFLLCFIGGVLIAGISISLYGSPGITIGASGGTMALIGALTTYVLTDPRVRPTRWGRSVAIFLCGLVLLELATDLVTPSISLAGHFGGFIGGAIIAWLGRAATTPQESSQIQGP